MKCLKISKYILIVFYVSLIISGIVSLIMGDPFLAGPFFVTIFAFPFIFILAVVFLLIGMFSIKDGDPKVTKEINIILLLLIGMSILGPIEYNMLKHAFDHLMMG